MSDNAKITDSIDNSPDVLKENARGVLQIIHNFATVNDRRHAAAFTAARFRALRCKRHKMVAQEVQDSDARGTRW